MRTSWPVSASRTNGLSTRHADRGCIHAWHEARRGRAKQAGSRNQERTCSKDGGGNRVRVHAQRRERRHRARVNAVRMQVGPRRLCVPLPPPPAPRVVRRQLAPAVQKHREGRHVVAFILRVPPAARGGGQRHRHRRLEWREALPQVRQPRGQRGRHRGAAPTNGAVEQGGAGRVAAVDVGVAGLHVGVLVVARVRVQRVRRGDDVVQDAVRVEVGVQAVRRQPELADGRACERTRWSLRTRCAGSPQAVCVAETIRRARCASCRTATGSACICTSLTSTRCVLRQCTIQFYTRPRKRAHP